MLNKKHGEYTLEITHTKKKKSALTFKLTDSFASSKTSKVYSSHN